MKLDQGKITEYYNSKQELWPESDPWHFKTHQYILDFVKKNFCAPDNATILNAGSGGNNYGIPEEHMVHLDIAEGLIENKAQTIVSTIEDIPVRDNSFTNILCVGSVLNYCDPIVSLKEFQRTLIPQGQMILEFEKSDSPELLLSSDFGKPAVLRRTFYDGDEEIIWYFSERYIKKLLRNYGFEIINLERFHLSSAFIYGLSKKPNFSSKFTILDKPLSLIPVVKKLSSNIIIHARLRN